MKYIYLAHPITKGNPFHNVNEACKAGEKLIKLGYVVMVPGLSALYDMICPSHYETYMNQDFAWIEKMDCLVRLPGESSGADREIEHAIKNNIPVFYGIQAFIDHVNQFADAEIKKLTTPIKQEEIIKQDE